MSQLTTHRLVCDRLESRQYLALQRVTDFGDFPAGTDGQIGIARDFAIFPGKDEHGEEPWVSDGTPAGTHLLKDLVPGPDSSWPSYVASFGSLAFFTAGYKLWRTDGSAQGTFPIDEGSGLNNVVANNRLFYVGYDASGGAELWCSDGTIAGTSRIRDIRPGTESSLKYDATFAAVGNVVYFPADDGVNGEELWRSDGTTFGTYRVSQIVTGTYSPRIQELASANGLVFFTANDVFYGRELWRSNGTAAGTFRLTDTQSFYSGDGPDKLTPAIHQLFFASNNPFSSDALWVSDGSLSGTRLVRDINATQGVVAEFNELVCIGDTVYFDAYVPSRREIWKSDGTFEGTTSVFVPDDYVGILTPAGNDLLFATRPYTRETELWRLNGATGQVVRVTWAVPGPAIHYVSDVAADNQRVFFLSVASTLGLQLYKSEGATAQVLSNCTPAKTGLQMTSPVMVGSDLFFRMNGGVYVSSEDESQPRLVAQLPSINGDWPNIAVAFNGRYLFSVDKREIWISDGTESGTIMVAPLVTSGGGFAYVYGVDSYVLGDRVVFVATDSADGDELWTSDGTAAGTNRVKSIAPGLSRTNLYSLTVIENVLYFGADDGQSGNELWRSDGTEAGTYRIADIAPGSASSWPGEFSRLRDTIFFTAADATGDRELWMTQGTAATTQRFIDLRPGTTSSTPEIVASTRDAMVFFADDGVAGSQLWVTEGTLQTTRRISSLPWVPDSLWGKSAIGSTVYFAADVGDGVEPWAVNVDTAALGSLGDLDSLVNGSFPKAFTEYDGLTYFIANNDSGQRLWQTDGTAAGTRLVTQGQPLGATPQVTTILESSQSLKVIGWDEIYGGQVWRLGTDSVAPSVSQLTFDVDSPGGPALDIRFSEAVLRSLSVTDIEVTELSTGATLPPSRLHLFIDWQAKEVRAAFRQMPDGRYLDDGRYSVRIRSSSIHDDTGNTLSGDGRLEFTFLRGDVNGDASVNFIDLLVVAQNYGRNDATFSQGDFNFDGMVNIDDLVVVTSAYATQLPLQGPHVISRGKSSDARALVASDSWSERFNDRAWPKLRS